MSETTTTTGTATDETTTGNGNGSATGEASRTAGILDPETAGRLDARWNDIQPRFVDDPQDAVADADALVTDTIDEIRSTLDRDRDRLEAEWQEGRDPSTEDLRRLMQRYRDLFSRLLDV